MTVAPNVGTKYVPGEGPDTCDIMIVGEAPGSEEEDQMP